MRSEKRPCANCDHDHDYGILRYSPDGVPIYGPSLCWCNCDRFVERNEEVEMKRLQGPGLIQLQDQSPPASVPSSSDKELQELWADTAFLNAQVPMATRIAVRQMTGLMKIADLPASLTAALTEFASLVISQITDVRGAMTRDDSKFAHLVAHTDEIVESMRGVVQLSERLTTIYAAIAQIQEQQQKTERDIAGIAAVLQKLAPGSVEIRSVESPDDYAARQLENRRMFLEKIGPLIDEPIVTSADPDND